MPVINEVTEALLLSMEEEVGTLPPDPEDMNHARAEAAFRSIRSFSRDFGESIDKYDGKEQRDMVQQNAKDLLTDLGHLFDRIGLDYIGLLVSAKCQYADETRNKGKQFNLMSEV